MIGLGGWGGRNEKSGPYVYYNEQGQLVRDEKVTVTEVGSNSLFGALANPPAAAEHRPIETAGA